MKTERKTRQGTAEGGSCHCPITVQSDRQVSALSR